jgi:nitroreductase
MDLMTALKERRSCRSFSAKPIAETVVNGLLVAAAWAPSPLNSQPWEFVVITAAEKKAEMLSEAERCHAWAVETSGWKWLGGYKMDFLTQAPVIVAVVGNPKKTGVDMFQAEGTVAYQHACAAAIQNLQLAAHAQGIGSLWFTFFDKAPMREILGIEEEKTPLALICLGYPAQAPAPVPRKDVAKVTRYIS